jgi:hypothetical protein
VSTSLSGMVCIPPPDGAGRALLSLQNVTMFAICCVPQKPEKRLRMPCQSKIRSSIEGKWKYIPTGVEPESSSTYLGKDIFAPLTLLITKYQFAPALRLVCDTVMLDDLKITPVKMKTVLLSSL